MLTVAEQHEINEEILLYPYPQAACIEALKVVQKHRGWVPDEQIVDIALYLKMSEAEVESVATFYSRIYRQPVGRNVILICDSMACLVMGYVKLYDYVVTKLGIKFGETTTDNRYTLLPISCLGDCSHAPALMINNDHYNELTIEKLDELLEKYT